MRKIFIGIFALILFSAAFSQDNTRGKFEFRGGVARFLELKDAPPSFVGQGGKAIRVNAGETALEFFTAAGSGTVTSFSAGTLSLLFTTSVANPTTTPALSFTLSNVAAGLVYARP